MKRIWIIAAGCVAMSTASPAADIATPRASIAPLPSLAVNWTGLYLGAFGGYGWGGRMSLDDESDNASALKGGFGGLTIGYNWQAYGSPLVWGIEVDAAMSGMNIILDQDDDVTVRNKVRNFGSVTGRLGFSVDAALFYVKGGYAWARNSLVADEAGGLSVSLTRTHSGWTVGAGLEYLLAQGWSAKAEYMYADYGKALYGPGIDNDYAYLGLTTHTLKAGLNYRF